MWYNLHYKITPACSHYMHTFDYFLVQNILSIKYSHILSIKSTLFIFSEEFFQIPLGNFYFLKNKLKKNKSFFAEIVSVLPMKIYFFFFHVYLKPFFDKKHWSTAFFVFSSKWYRKYQSLKQLLKFLVSRCSLRDPDCPEGKRHRLLLKMQDM